MQNLSPFAESLELMLVGMLAVFFALILVVLIGNLIIKISNKSYKEPQQTQTNKRASDNKTVAIITAAVDAATNGKAHIVSISKK